MPICAPHTFQAYSGRKTARLPSGFRNKTEVSPGNRPGADYSLDSVLLSLIDRADLFKESRADKTIEDGKEEERSNVEHKKNNAKQDTNVTDL